jgi:hypothetical protein
MVVRKRLCIIWGCVVIVGLLPLLAVIHMQTANIRTKTARSNPSVYYGAYVSGFPPTFSELTSFERDAGKSVSIVMWYQDWGITDGGQYFHPSWMNQVRSHGSIPMITWEPWNYQNGINQPAYQLRNIYNGKYDAYITRWAQDAKNWGHPFFLRFAHEMNGNWYSWSEQVNENKPGDYVKSWRHVHDIFVAKGVTNVTWVWSPNVEDSGSTPLAELYPGDLYVDWVGMDGYNWGTAQPGYSWQTFSQVFSQTYDDLQQLAPTKALMVAETAAAEEGGSKADWITDTYSRQLPTYFPNVKAIVWFNQNKERDWRIESSPSSQQAFARAVASPYYTSNQFSSLSSSPIPPLLPPTAAFLKW